MIRAVLWKEYREHRAVWVTLAAFAAAALYGLSRIMGPEGMTRDSFAHESLRGVSVLFAWTYGIVCGAMLLAVERESGTLDFLDMLPARRLELWMVKCLVGVCLFMMQIVFLCAIVAALDISSDYWELSITMLLMIGVGLYGMSWGLMFSARGESVLHIIGLAIGGQFLTGFGLAVAATPIMVLLGPLLRNHPWLEIVLGTALGIAVAFGPVVVSARVFSQPDRLRRRAAREIVHPQEEKVVGSLGRLVWLTFHQMRRLLVGLMIFSVAVGFLIPAVGPVAWPFLTLLIGTLCGVTACADEQMHGSFRFLGDQRFPLGRIWVVKIGMRYALALLAAFVLLLPSIIFTIAHRVDTPTRELRPPFFGEVLHSGLVGTVIPTPLHLTMWLTYGFAAGQLSGLLFRKSLVAAVLALGVAATLATFWVPSLVGMGLHFWQVMGMPAIFLVVGWMLVPAWAADRLLARGTFVSIGAALAAVGLWIAGGLWYRVAEIPDVPDQFDMPAFVAGIPLPDENEAGMKIRGAWGESSRVVRDVMNLRSKKPLFPGKGMVQQNAGNGVMASEFSFAAQLAQVMEQGWPAGRSDLGDWLDQDAFTGDWYPRLAVAADQPLGVVENPKDLTLRDDSVGRWFHAKTLNQLLAARGLQMQTRGEPDAFVESLHIGLALARNLQNHAPLLVVHAGRAAERVWPDPLDCWLEKLKDHPELLKRTLEILRRHEAELPNPADPVKAEYLIRLNTLEREADLFIRSAPDIRGDGSDNLREGEIGVAALLWLIPWEQERHRRLLRVDFMGNDRERIQAEELGARVLSPFHLRNRILPRAKREIARLHAEQLKVALRLYQAEEGKPAESLAVLVPKYLPSIPLDPFDGNPFRYRLSRGERIEWFGVMTDEDVKAMEQEPPPPPPPAPEPMLGGAAGGMGMPIGVWEPQKVPFRRLIPKGQGILWSVGEDGNDDGGTRQVSLDNITQGGEDILYLVPLPAK